MMLDPTPIKLRDLHRISTKAAIFTPDYSHVLVMHMVPDTSPAIYGLPGGHMDKDEKPDETIVREIHEELGITAPTLEHVDFFMHENGKIVLAYKGVLPFDSEFQPSNPAKEVGEWLTKSEFKAIAIEPGYKKLVLEHWQ